MKFRDPLSSAKFALVVLTLASTLLHCAQEGSRAAGLAASGEDAKKKPSAVKVPPKPPFINKGGVIFRALLDKEQNLLAPKVGNGSVVDTKLWPATVVAEADGGSCTATLIGPRVLLTAAHCVGNGAVAEIVFEDGSSHSGVCAHPEAFAWETNPSVDWALCRMKTAVVRKFLLYEHISNDSAQLKIGRKLTVGGFGCTDVITQVSDGLFRIGTLFIDRLPDADEQWPNWIFTQSANNDDGVAFVCPGDSGGGIYVEDGKRRFIVAVTSAVQTDSSSPDFKVSYLAALSTPAAMEFVGNWLKITGEKVCGLDPEPDNCRVR